MSYLFVLSVLIQTIVIFYYICAMDITKIMIIVESERLNNKVHKTTLCAKCGISTTYYNELLQGLKNPSLIVVNKLLKQFDIELIAVKKY